MPSSSPSGSLTAAAVSVAGLALVWGLVWAHLPSKEELLSDVPQVHPASPPVPAELDLTIPGVVSGPSASTAPQRESTPPNLRQARQIAEMKCDAEIQHICPDHLPTDEYRRCVEHRASQVSPACTDSVQRRIVRWKTAATYETACLDDVVRYCRDIQPGDDQLVQCLQDHAQSLSDRCYQSLPKGTLHYTP